MAKMYYTEAETAARLGVQVADLAGLARDGKLKAFQDGARRMFKSADVDALAPAASDEIELAPAGGDRVDLSKGESAKPPSKQDTVITSAGISIFDDDELEIEAADPMAKTQITPTLEEQMSTEGVGSGSGLLDLTRESDDTSLGAVLERIDTEPPAAATGGDLTGMDQPAMGAQVAQAAVPMVAEEIDPNAGLYTGLVGGAVVLALLILGATFASATEAVPGFVSALGGNLLMAWLVGLVVLGAGAGVGWFLNKSAVRR